MHTGEILRSSAAGLARAIRERKITSREAVAAHVARIRLVNPALNAVVRDRFDAAFTEADRADALVRDAHANDLPPLHGVPCTSKEAIAFEGMPYTSGQWSRRDVLAEEDAPTVRRLRDAGAIVLGVTNVSELCMWMESDNKVWGRTNNPYGLNRTAGGSSGGEGAIVGAGGAPIGLGADVGGSIRMPAFFNGVFGHKASGGLIPGTGHYPGAHHDVQRYLALGPITRCAEDLMPLVRILAGPDGREEQCVGGELGDPDAVDVSRLTVFSVEEHGFFHTERALIAAQRSAAAALEARGARVVKRELPALRRSVEIWSSMLREGGRNVETFRDLMAAGGPEIRPLHELGRFAARRSNYTLPAILLCLLEEIEERFPDRARRMAEYGRELRKELVELLGDNGVLLHPSHPRIAPVHRSPMLVPIRWVYTGIFNVMELPVTQVPLGLDPRGLPLGVQVVGPPGKDHMTIAVALELERRFGGWTPPPRWPLG